MIPLCFSECQKDLSAQGELIGNEVKCPNCGKVALAARPMNLWEVFVKWEMIPNTEH